MWKQEVSLIFSVLIFTMRLCKLTDFPMILYVEKLSLRNDTKQNVVA